MAGMKKLRTLLLAGLFLGVVLTSADAAIRQERINFKQGASSTTIKGRIKGYQTVDYQLRAAAGKTMTVAFKPGNSSAYFNVLPPDSDVAIFVGSTSGNSFEARLPVDGVYTLRVYLMRNAARRNETANYTLKAGLKDAVPSPALSFDRTLALQGLSFQVSCENSSSTNSLRIVPSGLEIDNTPIVRTIDGTVTGAEAADLNADGSPEIYVYVTSAGSGSFGSLVAYSANRRKSLSEIYLPPLTEEKNVSGGYLGHDEFAVLEGVLGRRFPVYRDTDRNARPTGGMRQLQYRLVPGEAGWILKLDRTVEY